MWAYNVDLRHKYLDALSKLDWGELVKNREASFHSLRNIFLHMINCEDWYLHTVIPNRGGKFVTYDFEEYTNIDSIRRKMEEVEAKTHKVLEGLNEEEFKKTFEYARSDGTKRRDSVEQILVHIVLEETHHRGELLCLLWEMNIQPPHEGWIPYLARTA
jgi:uncharacterized damage-inducible protein DinB